MWDPCLAEIEGVEEDEAALAELLLEGLALVEFFSVYAEIFKLKKKEEAGTDFNVRPSASASASTSWRSKSCCCGRCSGITALSMLLLPLSESAIAMRPLLFRRLRKWRLSLC